MTARACEGTASASNDPAAGETPGKARVAAAWHLHPAGLGALALLTGLALTAGPAAASDFQGSHHVVPYDEAPFEYGKWEAADPVARLAKRLEAGTLSLSHDSTNGYLRSFLKALDIPTSSQVLVFSKTSFHRDLISPESPRAIYFNDDVYVGWVRWAPVLEISAADPHRGGMFYVLPQNAAATNRVVRNHACIECHASRFSMGVPGHLLRSVATDTGGAAGDNSGGVRISHDTPVAERRGGWYVTGDPGEDVHLGNLIGPADRGRREAEPGFRPKLAELKAFLDTRPYLEPHSDLVALMVLEHQVHMHNYIARLNYESTLRLHQYGHINYVKKIADSFLQYLLFAEEAPLHGPVSGTSSFTREFEARGPCDSQGRSLRQFDLETRLFKYPCSYLIYSEAFDGLPAPMKEFLYQRLWDILNGRDDTGQFDHLRSSTRRAIVEILRETKPGLPDYWKHGSGSAGGAPAGPAR